MASKAFEPVEMRHTLRRTCPSSAAVMKLYDGGCVFVSFEATQYRRKDVVIMVF